jgi:hypothetical protein
MTSVESVQAATVQGLPYLTKRKGMFSAFPYAAALAISVWMVWLGLDSAWSYQRSIDSRILGTILAALGIFLCVCGFLALWILLAEATQFQRNPAGSIVLERLWLPSLEAEHVNLVARLGCVYRLGAPGEACVPYVIVRAGPSFVPMALQLYELLDQQRSSNGN